MPLFQKSVLQKHLKGLDNNKVNAAFEQFTAYFHNPTIQENIRNSKEEQFQAKFLDELFVKILGYTLNPKPDFNLTTEFKNVKGAKKADGAILKKQKAHGVIELKGTNTTDLGKVESQAFGYKNNHPTCKYVITSNFEKLRFYIEDAVDFEEFDLFNLKAEQFALLYLCLHKDQLLKDVALKIKKDSTLQEENITQKLYKDYSAFKKALFNDLVKNNPEHNQLILFKKSQKLLDRLLFIFFAEDKGLLPPNSISKIVENYEKLQDLDFYKPLYEVVQQYFNFINKGRPANKARNKVEIFGFNGGLFAPDELLDNLKISDEVLSHHTVVMSKYDFDSEVDVNILGHIFEHSLNEIDEMTATIEGRAVDKNKTKRKKDGVFYTPKYITKYIVENTIGKLCEEQKLTLGIDENEYRPKRNKSTKKRLLGLLEHYRSYLLDLTICDPACGSGAFLNQALDFLIQEHRYIDELKTKLLGGSIILSDITNDILERNIYGVDINEESVEIARLSLWLRTAQKGRALTNLSSNIKCGNSLIDDPEVAGEKAFKWKEEFPKVFEKGGFDVVLGNPPYVNFANLPQNQRSYFKKNSTVCKNKTDLYAFFVERGTAILKKVGKFSYIIPHTWVSTTSFEPLRKLFFDNYNINSLVELEHGVFKDAVVKTVIITCSKGEVFEGVPIFNENFKFVIKIPKKVIWNDKKMTINFDWTPEKQAIEDKLFASSVRLDSLLRFTRGIKTSNDKRFLHFEKKNEDYKKVIRGRNIKAYRIDYVGEYVWYRPDLMKEKVGCLPHTKALFEVPEKLITQRVNSSGQLLVTYDNQQYYCLDTTNVSVINTTSKINLKFILVVLNSRLINWWFNDKFKMPTISGYELHQIPIKMDKKLEEKLVNYANIKLTQEPHFKSFLDKFLNLLRVKFELQKPSKKLQNWHELEFGAFLKELKKKKIKLSLGEEADWMEYFQDRKAKAQQLKAEIDKTDKEIDGMVYELYGLTEEEIAIVANSK